MKRLTLLLAVCALSGCMFAHRDADDEERPDIAVGVGATVMYPGQAGPTLGAPPPQASASGGQAAPAAGSARSSGTGQDLTMIGGATGESSMSTKERQVPIIGPITTLIGYPFWLFGKSLGQKADSEAAKRAAGGGEAAKGAAAPTRDERERQRLAEENERVLRELHQSSPAPEARAASQAAPGAASSIGDELAALRRTLGQPPSQAPSTPRAPLSLSSAPEQPRDALDSDGDGRTDLWVYSEGGHRTRDVHDDNQDGKPDRVASYGPDEELARVEEDTDGDGRLETVTLYEQGSPARKRVDDDGDGQPDAWSFFSHGALVRHEVDRNHDGFRDVVQFFESGDVVREEQDQNADGRPDIVLHFASGEVSQRDEDLDFDGVPDVQSYYENGKLVRREVRSEELMQRSPGANAPTGGT